MERPVPYDPNGGGWKMGRQMAKFPSKMLTESVIFTPHLPSEVEYVQNPKLETEVEELRHREKIMRDDYNKLVTKFESLKKDLDNFKLNYGQSD